MVCHHFMPGNCTFLLATMPVREAQVEALITGGDRTMISPHRPQWCHNGLVTTVMNMSDNYGDKTRQLTGLKQM